MNEQERRKDLEAAADKFVLDWFEDVIHARHLERIGQDPPDWMRAGWPDPLAPSAQEEPEEMDEDVLADDLLLDELLFEDGLD